MTHPDTLALVLLIVAGILACIGGVVAVLERAFWAALVALAVGFTAFGLAAYVDHVVR